MSALVKQSRTCFKRVILPEEGVGVSEESLIIIVYEYNHIQGDFLRFKNEYIISA